MKTKFGVILFLLCFVIFSFDALAVDYTFKTTITRVVAKTITPDNTAGCDGAAVNNPPINYNVTEVDNTITSFSIRFYKKVGGALYLDDGTHAIVTSGGSKNFDLTTGEFSYTVTGITKTKDILIAKLYNQTSGETLITELEMSASSSNVRVQAGYVSFGNIGNGSGAGSAGSISAYGGAISSASISNPDATTSDITVNFDDLGDTDYVAIVTLQGLSGASGSNRNATVPIVHSKSSSSFKVNLGEIGDTSQNLRLDFIIQGY